MTPIKILNNVPEKTKQVEKACPFLFLVFGTFGLDN